MNTVKVRNLEIGSGLPKICVPIVGSTKEEIFAIAEHITSYEVDMVEWRADWFDGLFDEKRVREILGGLREILKDIPILFTIRTKEEGGQVEIQPEVYERINLEIAQMGFVDLIDIEVFKEGLSLDRIVESIKRTAVVVVGSNHDFHKTPDKKEIIQRLCFMQERQMDILKIAVMPQSEKDVLELLSATAEMKNYYANRPLITMSMGRLGIISRISGAVFGSAVTFGTVGQSSAPGQLHVEQLRRILYDLQ